MEKQKQEDQLQFIYPVPFEDFVGFRKKQSQAVLSGFSIKQLGKLRKVKKILEETQEKINNRIKLFKKVSIDIRKKKQKQNHLHERIQNVKRYLIPQQQRDHNIGQGYMRSTKSSLNLIRIKNHSLADKNQSSIHKLKTVQSEKIDNVKELKLQKQRNRAIVQERKIKQMREKLQSANIIRSHRNRAKQIKQQYEQQRFEEARKMKQQRWRQQVEKYDELQENLTRLQREEREALIMWKRAMEEAQ